MQSLQELSHPGWALQLLDIPPGDSDHEKYRGEEVVPRWFPVAEENVLKIVADGVVENGNDRPDS